MTHSSPSRTALVRIEPASDPASGSDRQNAGDHSPDAHFGNQRCFCSSVPNSWIGSVPSSCTIRISAQLPDALAISSTAICSINVPVPVPPYSSANGSPRMSCSPNNLRMSHGYSAVASISAARGQTRSFDDLSDRLADVLELLRDVVEVGVRVDGGHAASVFGAAVTKVL